MAQADNKAGMFVTWSENDKQSRAIALAQTSNALHEVRPIIRSNSSNLYFNVAPQNVSVRDGMSRQDYDAFRPEDAIPAKSKDLISACMAAYENVGIIKNIIDLMSDFATQGIDLNHPNEKIEAWHKEWFRRVGGKERSERFLNLLYRTANVIIQRQTAKISVKTEQEFTKAAPDTSIPPPPNLEKREIPWSYVFRNPLTTEVIADELSLFVGQDAFTYAIKIPRTLTNKIKQPRTEAEKALIEKLPKDVLKAIRDNTNLIPIPADKVRAFYYKRDDWQVWARPMISAILPDLQLLSKMKLADLAALDGAMSAIRVWKLGSIEHRIMPTAAAIARLSEMLCNNVGGGVMDLVWGPELELVETKTDVHHFLGETKYAPVLTAIYAGLGIPPTLTGAATQSGFTNNYISLKTLTERLEYGRALLTTFWEGELRLIQKAMGFRKPASLVFDRMVLTDEAAEKQLLINLADRDLISVETLMERFGETPEIEKVRIKRELRKREKGQAPPKAGPWHSPEKQHEYTKMFVQQGTLTPSQVGVQLEDKKSGEKTPLEMQAKNKGDTPNSNSGQPNQGRPKQSRDSKKRKKKTVKPRASASFIQLYAWAEQAQAQIGQIAQPALLKAIGKKNLRELTDEEVKNFEGYKFFLLCQLAPNQEVTEQTVASLSQSKFEIPQPVSLLLKAAIAKHVEKSGHEPTIEVARRLQAGAFALWCVDSGVKNETGESHVQN